MFYYLSGRLTLLRQDTAVIDCGGVGYLLSISENTYLALTRTHPLLPDGSCDGKEAKLFTHLSVKEDAQELYGFYDETERDVFRLLITVSGIGPKGALSVLSALSVGEIAAACASGDAKTIARANGIGLKTAQKVIIELKDKIEKTVSGAPVLPETGGSDASGLHAAASDAVAALVVLGYNKNEAAKAVKAAGGENVEEMIRRALSLLMK